MPPPAPRRDVRPQRAPLHRGGFTLLELLVVMAIIGLLASYVGPKYFSQLGQSEHKVAQAQVSALSNALDTFRLDVGRYPSTAEGLSALYARPPGLARWNGPYLRKPVPPDPWGHAYVYRNPGSGGREVDVMSLGSDGRPGGSDLAADVLN